MYVQLCARSYVYKTGPASSIPPIIINQRCGTLDWAARSRLREVAHCRVLPPLAREEHIELPFERGEECVPELAIQTAKNAIRRYRLRAFSRKLDADARGRPRHTRGEHRCSTVSATNHAFGCEPTRMLIAHEIVFRQVPRNDNRPRCLMHA